MMTVKRCVVLGFFLCMMLISGCSMDREIEELDNAALVFMESEPVLDYTVPKESPGVIVDRLGYSAEGKKLAYVRGKRLPENYGITDTDTGNVVYWGIISDITYDEKNGLYTGRLEFDDLKSGNYYIECEYIGRSYSFAVEEGIYRKVFDELYEKMLESYRHDSTAVRDMTALLFTYEWHTDVFRDENGNEIPDLMEFTVDWIKDCDLNKIADSERMAYAAFLAKFSYLYRQFDLGYATECLQMASTVFSRAEADGVSEERFLALTELYRATGLLIYENEIVEYTAYFQNHPSFLKKSGFLYGAMTYLVTRQKTDTALCDLFMRKLMNYGGEAASAYGELMGLADQNQKRTGELLEMSQALICANYVLESFQYYGLSEDFFHFLMGRNSGAGIYEPQEGERNAYLTLAAQLVEIEEKELGGING